MSVWRCGVCEGYMCVRKWREEAYLSINISQCVKL